MPLPRQPLEGPAYSRVPFRVYQDPSVYRGELDKIFSGPTWNYLGLDCEIPNAGDFRRTFVGEREVLMLRHPDGTIGAVENRCAHRGAQICQAMKGNTGRALICPYHQWTFNLKGDLTGLPYRRGIRGKGGMPADFDMTQHGLTQLKVEVLNGVVFGSFDPDVQPLREYLGPAMEKYFTRVFDGRKLRIVGVHRQMIDCNWKLQMENLKDPYHAGILHTFLVKFGLYRLDQKSAFYKNDENGHSVMMTSRGSEKGREDTGGVQLKAHDFVISDPDLLKPRMEFKDDVTLSIQTIFPNLIVQAQSNTLATRHAIPRGPGKHELVWTFFGYEDDDEEMRMLRLRQANLMGPAGFVTLDDAEALEFSQIGIDAAPPEAESVLELGRKGYEANDHLVTETLIRGFYRHYARLMDMPVPPQALPEEADDHVCPGEAK
jgi:salicylate 5-hydroxylase large subunit